MLGKEERAPASVNAITESGRGDPPVPPGRFRGGDHRDMGSGEGAEGGGGGRQRFRGRGVKGAKFGLPLH